MNKKEMIREVASKAGMTQKDTGVVVEALFETIKDELSAGGEVSVAGFGKFASVHKEAYTARNPQDGSDVEVPAHNIPKFRASSVLKEAVR